jgi:hypothetical protein
LHLTGAVSRDVSSLVAGVAFDASLAVALATLFSAVPGDVALLAAVVALHSLLWIMKDVPALQSRAR